MLKAEMMENSLFKKVEIVTVSGKKIVGKVKGFETAYDNDEENEASICLETENGNWFGYFESDIDSIKII